MSESDFTESFQSNNGTKYLIIKNTKDAYVSTSEISVVIDNRKFITEFNKPTIRDNNEKICNLFTNKVDRPIINSFSYPNMNNERKVLMKLTEGQNKNLTDIQEVSLANCNEEKHQPKVKNKAEIVCNKLSNDFNIANNTQSPVNDKKFAEKMTYCRPVLHFYNQEYIYKTIERNKKLKTVVQKLVSVREKERQKEAWKNYINELKNKHRYPSSGPSQKVIECNTEDYTHSDLIEDYLNTKFYSKQSIPCENLLDNFYKQDAHIPVQQDSDYPALYEYDNIGSHSYRVYDNDPYCYPTSSQGRLLMLNKERKINHFANHWINRPVDRNFCGDKIIFSNEQSNKGCDTNGSFKKNIAKSSSMQTDFNTLNLCSRKNIMESVPSDKESIKDKYNKVSENIERLKKKAHKSQSYVRENSLSSIENKLDNLIQSVNAFIVEIKSHKTNDHINNFSVTSDFKNTHGLDVNKSDNNLTKMEGIACGETESNNLKNTSLVSRSSSNKSHKKCSKCDVETILTEENDKSNKAKRDLNKLLETRACYTIDQTISDIPTKEKSIDVTNSISIGKLENDNDVAVEELETNNYSKNKCMTIAVNTEPIGILGLIKISTEMIKQVLSYMPHINYHSYLPILQFTQASKICESHYVCNICGAAFGRPSQLSDHIRDHNLGKTRDCCVCRHVLDMQHRRSPKLFECQYCGQRFTRAYCCELHQQTCAKRFGKQHDVASNLSLLR